MLDIGIVLMFSWMYAVEIALSGIITALVIMSFMVAIMRLLQVFSEKYDNSQPATESPVSKEVVYGGSSSDEQLVVDRKAVAAITAAVTSFLEEQVPSYKAGKITVSREPSPTTSKNNWKMAGRRNLLQNRLKLEKIRRNKQRENI